MNQDYALFNRLKTRLDKRAAHVLLFERPHTATWEEIILKKSEEIPFFFWHCILFYRKKKSIPEPVSTEEVQGIFTELPDRETAVAVLSELLHKDMAYGAKMMPQEEADLLATDFLSLFGEKSRYFSNATWQKEKDSFAGQTHVKRLNGWKSLTEATFDSGIIVADTDKIGIVWFEDED